MTTQREALELYLDMMPLNEEALPGKGPVPADHVFVGIAPSPNRPHDRRNEPFGARSWVVISKLKSLIEESGSTLYTTNLIKIPQSPGVKVSKKLITSAYPILIEELKIVRPRRILALGGDVASVLCPGFSGMREDHGTLFWNPETNCVVVPTFHFSALFRDPERAGTFQRDFERFMTLPNPEPPRYRQLKSPLKTGILSGRHVFIDLETEGLDPRSDGRIISIGFIGEGDDEVVRVIENPSQQDLKILMKSLTGKILVGHNLSFDLEWLFHHTGSPWENDAVEDTMLMAKNLGELSISLKSLTSQYTDRPGSRAFGGYESIAYLAEDVLSTRELFMRFDKTWKNPPIREILNRALPLLVRMRLRGVFINRDLLTSLEAAYQKRLTEKLSFLNEAVGSSDMNWNSPPQVVQVFKRLKIPLKEKTEAGAFSVKESVLLSLKDVHPVVSALLEYRADEKTLEFLTQYAGKTTAVHPLLHPSFLLWGTDTGRLSGRGPNLQQVSRTGPLKTLFVSVFKNGLIGLIDLDQAELRIACMLSGDEKFFVGLTQGDFHRDMASLVYGKPPDQILSMERKKSKGVTFGLLYGGEVGHLIDRLGLTGVDLKKVKERILVMYPKLNRWIQGQRKKGVREHEVITYLGRRRNLSPALLSNFGEGAAGRQAINTPVQGLASDINLIIFNEVMEQLIARGLKSRVWALVHDSILLDVHPSEVEAVGQIVQQAFIALSQERYTLTGLPFWGRLPMTGSFTLGKSWAEVEETNEGYSPSLTLPCSSHPDILLKE